MPVFLVVLGSSLQISCQKSSSSSAGAVGGGPDGGTTTTEEEVDLEVSGVIDPADFVQAQDSVEIGGVNLTTTATYAISVFYLSAIGKKVFVHQRTSDSERFSFKIKVPKRYMNIVVTRLSDGYRLGALLPPALRNKLAKLRLNRTSSIAAKIADIIADKAVAGNEAALKALSTKSISVADTLVIAQSVARVITEQAAQNKGSIVNLARLAEKLIEKSNDKIKAIQDEGQSPTVVAEKISETTYATVFSGDAENISPGVLAYRTNHDLGTSTVAKRDVAYESIGSLSDENTKYIDAAFRVEAEAYRNAISLSDAVAAESTITTSYSAKFSDCYAGDSSCAPAGYTPPTPPPSSSADGGGSSAGTTGGESGTLVELRPPSAPTSVTGTAFNAQVSLSWNPPSDDGGSTITGYLVQYSGDGGATWATDPNNISTNSSIIVTGLTNGTLYLFRVAATNEVGTGEFSIPSESLKPTTSASAPTSVSGIAGDSEVSLSWVTPEVDGGGAITDYEVGFKEAAAAETTWITFNDGTSIANSATVTGLSNGTAYIFRVAAVNSTGIGSYGISSSAIIPSAPVAPEPKNLTANASSSTQIDLSWSSGGEGTVNYQIAYQTGATAPADCDSGVIIDSGKISNATAHSIDSLIPGIQYSFRVCSANSLGTLSGGISISGRYTLAENPSSLTVATVSSTQIDLSWISGGMGTVNYQIAYQTGATAPVNCYSGTIIDSASINNATTYSLGSLSPGTQYSFRVCPANALGTLSSGTSASGSYTLAENPPSITATAVSSTQLDLSWVSGGIGTVNYQIAYQSGATAPENCYSGTIIDAATINNATTYSIDSLTPGTQYSFRVCSANALGTLSSGTSVSGRYTLAENPSSLTASPGGSLISLSWTAGLGATKYKVVSQTGTTAPENCNTGQAQPISSNTSASLGSFTYGTVVSARVCSINTAGDLSAGITLTGYTVFAQAGSLNYTPLSSTSIRLNWGAATGASQYKLSYQSGSTAPANCDSGTTILAQEIGNSTSYTIDSLSPGGRYSFVVCPGNSIGVFQNFSTSKNTSVYTIAGEPSSIVVTASTSTSISLSWTAGVGATSYRIVKQVGETAPTDCSTGATTSSANSATVYSLSSGTQYAFRVCSYNLSNLPSPGVATTSIIYTQAVNPTSLIGTGSSSTSIGLTWVAGAGANQYQIAYQTGTTAPADCNSGTIITAATAGNVTSYDVPSLTAGTAYSFRVCSTNPIGVLTTGVTVTNRYPLAPNPTGLSATKPATGSVKLTWTSGGSGTTRYQIAYQEGSNNPPANCSSGTVISSSTVNTATNYTITGLTTGTTYSFRVCATNFNGTLNSGVTVDGTP
jgi:hypothetical protein